LMNLTTAIGSVADTIIIGQYLDNESLSVTTFATPIYMIINTFAALFSVGGCIAMSIDAGKGKKESANKAFSTSIELLAFTGLLLLLGGVFFSSTITHWLGAGSNVFEAVREYSFIILAGSPLFMLNIGLAFFVRNDGRPTLSMVGMFASIAVDVTLNFVFVGKLGMGVSGAALSTVLGQIASIVIICMHFFTSKNTLKFRFALDKTVFRIIKNGASSALHFVYQFLTILIINHFLSVIAEADGVVIYTVVFNLSTVSLSVFEGISQTIQPMVSNYAGEKSFRKIKETMRLAIIAIFVICGCVTLFLELKPELVPIVFGIDGVVMVEKAAVAVRIFATSMIIMTINVVIGYYLQSTEQNLMASVIVSLRCFALFLAATFGLGILFGLNGVWAAYTVSEILTLFIIVCMVKYKQKKLMKSGINSNFMLLDDTVEKGAVSYICNLKKDNYDDYLLAVEKAVQESNMDENSIRTAIDYLCELKSSAEQDKAKYIEVEINSTINKIIIRDNLKRATEFDAVLGWNRICIG
ncbi:MAG: hypothetical protein J6C24_02155, partial [Clostridia bacterium]|nr:hypothetical protein [Clostridia bacterium]